MVSSGEPVWGALRAAAPHSYMPNSGGAIGQGLPLAVGAALACPEGKVIALQADGDERAAVLRLEEAGQRVALVGAVKVVRRQRAVPRLQGDVAAAGQAVADEAGEQREEAVLRGLPLVTEDHRDGGMGLGGFDVETAVRSKLPVVYLLSNNSAWMAGSGIVYQHAMPVLGEQDEWTHWFMHATRYDQVFAAMGAYTERLEDPTKIKETIARAFDHAVKEGRPAVVDTVVDRVTLPTGGAGAA
jgi:thiamine pyrophosphate-dependent acetolactate synthase large subunit-like protein